MDDKIWRTKIEIMRVKFLTGWLQVQICILFIPTWGNDPIWRAYFSDGWFNHQLDKGNVQSLMLTAPFSSHGFGLWVKRVPHRVLLEHYREYCSNSQLVIEVSAIIPFLLEQIEACPEKSRLKQTPSFFDLWSFGYSEAAVSFWEKGLDFPSFPLGKFIEKPPGRSWIFSPKLPDSMWDLLCLGAVKCVAGCFENITLTSMGDGMSCTAKQGLRTGGAAFAGKSMRGARTEQC